MYKTFKLAGWVFLALVCLGLSLQAGAASPPGLIHYQGVLRSASGAPLTGSYDMTFTFYSASSGGDQILVDTHTGGAQVGVVGGLFTTALGGGTVIDGTGPGTYTSLGNAFRDYGTVYVEIVVGGETLNQRVRVVSSAYALNADNLDGLDSASFSLTSHNHAGTYLPLAGGTMAGNIAFSGAQTVDGIDLSASAATWNSHLAATSNVHGLTYTAEGTGGGLDADLLDGQHASAFATTGHFHSTLTRGTGLSGSNYDGSAPATFAVAYGTASGTAVQGDQTATITAGNGLSGGISANALGDGFSATLDVGAGSGISVSANAIMLGPLTADWDQTGKYDIILNHADSMLRFLESAGATYFGALDVGDLSANATYTFGGASGTVWTSGNDGAGSTLDADLLDGQHASAFGDRYSLDASDGSPTDVVYVDASGHVGVGTTTPNSSAKLDIEAVGTASTNYGIYTYVSNGTANNEGIHAETDSTSLTNATSYGGHFIARGHSGYYGVMSWGVEAEAYNYIGCANGVSGYAETSNAGTAYGIFGDALATGNGDAISIYADTPEAWGTGRAYAGYFNGDIRVNGRLGISLTPSSYQLQLSVDSAAKPSGGNWTNPSDLRLKKNIRPFSDGLGVIARINPVRYQYNGLAGMPKDMECIGVVAQQIMQAAPYTVGTFKAKLDEKAESETELYDFNSGALTFVMINAIKELDARTKGLAAAEPAVEDPPREKSPRADTSLAGHKKANRPQEGDRSLPDDPPGIPHPELFPVCEQIDAGEVLVADSAHPGAFCLGRLAGDPRVVGIATSATGPATEGSSRLESEVGFLDVHLAMQGITYCKVDASYGLIQLGDLLTASATPGHAMRAPKPAEQGTVLGKALESLPSGTGLIKVLVMLR